MEEQPAVRGLALCSHVVHVVLLMVRKKMSTQGLDLESIMVAVQEDVVRLHNIKTVNAAEADEQVRGCG